MEAPGELVRAACRVEQHAPWKGCRVQRRCRGGAGVIVEGSLNVRGRTSCYLAAVNMGVTTLLCLIVDLDRWASI